MNFLKSATIFLALAQASLFSNEPVRQESPKVAVIGAGLAGLTCAYRLQQNGFDVDVYEARNRVGGRIFSVKINDIAAELGGQNILDGGDAEATRSLVEELGLELTGGKLPLTAEYQKDGQSYALEKLLEEKNFDPDELKERMTELAQNSSNMREVLDKLFEKTDPLYTALSVRLSAWEGGPAEKLSTLCAGTLYQQMLGGVSVTHPALLDSDESTLLIEIFSIKGGNSLLPKKLADILGNKVHLNRPLSSIEKNSQGYQLVFTNGEKKTADIVVLAVPSSVYSDIGFGEDVIPEDRLDAMKKIEYGTITRIVSPLDVAFEKGKAVFADSLLVLKNPNLSYFTTYCVGESSRFTAETAAIPYQEALKLLELPTKTLPVMARDEFVASYHGPVAHSWPNDPYVKGSYSYIAAGQEEVLTAMEEIDGVPVRTLFAPIDGNLFFAGEHTTILLDGIGTIDAACESGERAAKLVAKTAKK